MPDLTETAAQRPSFINLAPNRADLPALAMVRKDARVIHQRFVHGKHTKRTNQRVLINVAENRC